MQYFQQEQMWDTEYPPQETVYENRVDQGEKILPAGRRKKPVYRLRFRLLVAICSTLAFLIMMAVILVNSSQPVFPNLTTVDVLLAIVSYVGINVIIHVLFDRVPLNIDRDKNIALHVIAIIVALLLMPVLCWMMIQGNNGIDGLLLVVVGGGVAITLSYLTMCQKRHLH